MYPQTPQFHDHAAPPAYPYPPKPRSSRYATQGAYAVAVIALAAVAATMAMFLAYKSTADAQITQLRHQAVTMNSELQNARTADTSSYNGLSGKVNAMSTIVGSLTAFGMICSQDLTGPNGPAQFFFPCTGTKPGG